MPKTAAKGTRKTVTREMSTDAPPKPQASVHDLIAMRAYHLYLEDGCRHGGDLDHWLKAEREIRNGTAAR